MTNSPPRMYESGGRFFIASPHMSRRYLPVQDGSEVCVWLAESDTQGGGSGWHETDNVAEGSDVKGMFSALEELLAGRLLLIRGDANKAVQLLDRLWRILSRMGLSSSEVLKLFCRCTTAIRHGKLCDISMPCGNVEYYPEILARMMRESTREVVYVPAYIVLAFHRDVLESIDTPGDWLHGRFVSVECDIEELLFGKSVHVKRGVFVPDPVVLDLLASVFFRADSPLRQDLAGATVFEPCTGSGILAAAAVRMGAVRVVCTEIDMASSDTAELNFNSWGISDRVSLIDHLQFPRAQEATMVLVNPPWIGGAERIEIVEKRHLLRCLCDPGHTLLSHILKGMRTRMSLDRPFYVFLGQDDCFDVGTCDDSAIRLETAEFGWQITHRWEGFRGVRLYRLQGTAGLSTSRSAGVSAEYDLANA
jgi:hypothetical protein